MPLQIEIPEDNITYLSLNAKTEFCESTKKYAEELIEEASRLEAAGRSDEDSPEITATMIKDAVLHLKKYPPPQKQKLGYLINQIISYSTTLLTGILFNFKQFQNDAISLILFLIVLTVAIITTTIHLTHGRK